MLRSSRVLAVFSISLLLVGCGGSLQGAPDRLFSKTEELEQLRIGYGEDLIAQYNSATGSKKLEIRDRIVLGRIYAMDIEYGEFERKLTRERQKIPFLATTASIALSGTGSLIADRTTKSILAAVDTGLKGVKESYDKEILFKKTIDFIIQEMRSNRLNIKTIIIERLSNSSFAYPLEFALSDLEEYYRAGTITSGLIGISAQTAIKLEKTQSKHNQLITAALAGATSPTSPLDEQPGPSEPSKFCKGVVECNLSILEAREIQRSLCVKPQDGKFGPDTRKQIRLFQLATGRPANGKIDNTSTADDLIHDGTCFERTEMWANAYEKFKYQNSKSIEGLQKQLVFINTRIDDINAFDASIKNFESQFVTGKFDELTRQAIGEFEHSFMSIANPTNAMNQTIFFEINKEFNKKKIAVAKAKSKNN